MPLLRMLLCVLMLIAGSGCITNRQLVKTFRKSPAYSSFAKHTRVSGTYNNLDSAGPHKLSSELFFWQGFNYNTLVDDASIATVRLNYGGGKHLLVAAQDQAGKTTEIVLRVKNKGAYLSVKRKLYLIPIPFLFFIQHEQKTILTMAKNGDLIAVYGDSQFGWILFAAGHDERRVSVFRRL